MAAEETDFDPVQAGYSSDEPTRPQAPSRGKHLAVGDIDAEVRKRVKLPSAKELLKANSPPDFLAGVDIKRTKLKTGKKPTSAVIEKPPVLNPAKIDPLEQYDYFARDPDANLSLWQSPQDLPDADRPWDKRKLIKKIDTRRVAVLGLEGRGKYEKQHVNRWEVPLPDKK